MLKKANKQVYYICQNFTFNFNGFPAQEEKQMEFLSILEKTKKTKHFHTIKSKLKQDNPLWKLSETKLKTQSQNEMKIKTN